MQRKRTKNMTENTLTDDSIKTNGLDQSEPWSKHKSTRRFEKLRNPQPTLMEKIDQSASQKVEITRGTIWLLGVVLILAGVVFSYGGSLLGWVREDESQRARTAAMERNVEEMRNDMKELKTQFTALQKSLVEQAISSAKIDGFEAGVAETKSKEK